MRRIYVGLCALSLGSSVGCDDDAGDASDAGAAGAASENTSATCQDDVDNDSDGATDCADADCAHFPFCDVTLCADHPCDANATCDDTGGEAVCTCNPGWEGDGESCQNTDECSGGSHDCAQICTDTDGSYTCSCDDGYDLDADGHSCDIRDCGTTAAPTDGSVTFPTGTTYGGTAEYDCDSGYYLLGDAQRACDADGSWSGTAPTCAVCDLASSHDCLCEGTPDLVYCDGNTAVACGGAEELLSIEDCGAAYCVDGLGCQDCLAGDSLCFGNEVHLCDAGPPATWTTIAVCDAAAGYRCDAAQQSCEPLVPVGGSAPTGTHRLYWSFSTANSAYLGGADVDSYGDLIYVHRFGGYLDVYQVVLYDTDGDGNLEPDQHPDNLIDPGPVEQRTLTHIATYDAVTNNVPLGQYTMSEMYAAADRIYVLSPAGTGDVSEWVFATETASVAVDSSTDFPLISLGFGVETGLWYGSNNDVRRVYSFHAPTLSWVAEFDHPSLGGSATRNLEVVVDPSTDIEYVYVMDEVIDRLGQYRRDGNGDWVQENVFALSNTNGTYPVGLGYGAHNHFWANDVDTLMEIGGGGVTPYVE